MAAVGVILSRRAEWPRVTTTDIHGKQVLLISTQNRPAGGIHGVGPFPRIPIRPADEGAAAHATPCRTQRPRRQPNLNSVIPDAVVRKVMTADSIPLASCANRPMLEAMAPISAKPPARRDQCRRKGAEHQRWCRRTSRPADRNAATSPPRSACPHRGAHPCPCTTRR